jgi:hypothetical protein
VAFYSLMERLKKEGIMRFSEESEEEESESEADH